MNIFTLILYFTSMVLPANPFTSHGILDTHRVSNRNIHPSHLFHRIDRQSDEKYGRGTAHISADINEGEVIAYQDGTWYVDGNAVGDGSEPKIRYMLVDAIQIVWTHNCEHGVLHGFDVTIRKNEIPVSDYQFESVDVGSVFEIGNEYVGCGPEQVLAKIPTSFDTDGDVHVSLARFLRDEEILKE